jgi:hypothetical protein
MISRLEEASARDLSRLAWLELKLGDDAKASEFVQMGLEMDSDDQHCIRLKERLGL